MTTSLRPEAPAITVPYMVPVTITFPLDATVAPSSISPMITMLCSDKISVKKQKNLQEFYAIHDIIDNKAKSTVFLEDLLCIY